MLLNSANVSIMMPLTMFPNKRPKNMKYIKSVANLTIWKDYTDPPMVPETYKSRTQVRILSHASSPPELIIYRAYVSKKTKQKT